MATATKMDLGKMRCEIAGTNRELTGACSGVSVNIRNANKMDVRKNFMILFNLFEIFVKIRPYIIYIIK